jgi:SAM-dependent methyltransferase
MDEFKERQRTIWAAGDYPTLAEHLVGVGELLVERAGVQPGSRVLDVACGPGTATLPAARAGGDVAGLDFSPELLAAGRTKAEPEGLDVEWVGDGEALPFDDETFDYVISMFGSVAGELTFERHDVTFEWDSVDGFADYVLSRFPTMVTAQHVLGERWPDLRAGIVELWNEANEADDGSLR